MSDYFLVTSTYGYIRLNNGTFFLITINPTTKAVTYFAKRDFSNFKHYQFDFKQSILYISNGTHINSTSIIVTTNSSTGAISNLSWSDKILYKWLTHTSFSIQEPYLIIYNPTADSNVGRI